jgi:hypothetical protein
MANLCEPAVKRALRDRGWTCGRSAPTCRAAEPLYQRAATAAERVLGAEHPDTKTIRANWEGLRASRRPPHLRGWFERLSGWLDQIIRG